MEKKIARQILKKVRDDYNAIAKEWDEKRSRIFPLRRRLLRRIPAHARVLDAGCGNGIVYEFLAKKSIAYTGIDVSARLIRIARARARAHKDKASFQFKVGSIIKLPFKDKQFTHVLCSAVLHHIPSAEARRAAMHELYRVLLPGGELQLTVWNLASDFTRVKFNLDEQLAHPRAWLEQNDVLIPWRATAGTHIERYLHLFTRDELYDLARSAGFKKIRCAFYNKQDAARMNVRTGSNIVLIAKR